jgi:hypothetical protein
MSHIVDKLVAVKYLGDGLLERWNKMVVKLTPPPDPPAAASSSASSAAPT